MKGRGVFSRLGTVGLVMVMVLCPMAVWADVVADGDKVELNASYPALNLGTVCVGSSASGELGLYVKRNGSYGSPNVFANDATVTWTVGSINGDGLAASISPSSITLPSNWSTIGNNVLSDGVTAYITFTPASAGSFAGQITFRATGTGSASGSPTLTREGPLAVVANAEVCAPADTTPPTTTATATANGAPYAFGTWTKYDVEVTLSATDNEGGSGVASTKYKLNDGAWMTYTGPFTVSTEGVTEVSFFSTDNAGNDEDTQMVEVWIDKTPPTISGSASPAPNAAGWNNTDVVVTFTCGDNLSGLASCGPNQTLSSEGAGQSVTGEAVDNAGNSATTTVSGINIDKTPPSITWSNGPVDGASYYFGFVPAAPTCTASDDLSGPNGCSVSGYNAAVGKHTLTATAYDVAGNKAEETRSYTVLAWTLLGFYRPVEMGEVWNTVKGGSTVPLKFEVFAGDSELTDTAVVQSLQSQQVPCSAGTEDPVDATATGGTSLRYDWVEGQFVFNWQTPKKPNTCYKVTMTSQDGSPLWANFKLK